MPELPDDELPDEDVPDEDLDELELRDERSARLSATRALIESSKLFEGAEDREELELLPLRDEELRVEEPEVELRLLLYCPERLYSCARRLK